MNTDGRKGKRISIYINKDILEWINAKIEDLVFANRSHAFQRMAREWKKKYEETRKGSIL